MSVASIETVPATELAPAANVNVVAGEMIVAAFMALLNVAVTAAPWQMPETPTPGFTETTVGGVSGEPGFPTPEFLSGSLHAVVTMSSRNAVNQILELLFLGMTIILFLPGFTATVLIRRYSSSSCGSLASRVTGCVICVHGHREGASSCTF
jgi:hypothetical protein